MFRARLKICCWGLLPVHDRLENVIRWMAIISMMAFIQGALAQPCSLDSSFNPDLDSSAAVYVITFQPNGQILIGGSFSSVQEVPRANLARLNPDGALDETFDPGLSANIGYVNAIAVQKDGKLMVGGAFFSSSGGPYTNLMRLNPTGSVDTGFDSRLALDGPVNVVVIQSDDRILFGGDFAFVHGLARRSIARVNSDGGLDRTFDACVASSAGAGATGLAVLTNGQILASGLFTFSTGLYRYGIARLNSCGDLDPTYAAAQPGLNTGATAFTLALRKNNTVLLGGDFTGYHGTPRQGIAQLTTSGNVDLSFSPGTGIDDGTTVYTIALQPDGKALIGGNFGSYNGQSRFGIARINPDGSLEPGCNAGTGPNNSVSSFAIQSDGKILVAGKFTSFNGESRSGLVRLNGDPKLGAPAQLDNGQVQLLFQGQDQSRYTLQAGSDLTNWLSVITNFTVTNSPMTLVDPDPTTSPIRFYRIVSEP